MIACAQSPSRHLCRSLPSSLPAVEAVCREIRALVDLHGLHSAAFSVELAARECLINAARHGNRGQVKKRVELDLRIGRRWILLAVADQGRGFNWRRARHALLRSATAQGGRGLAICFLYAQRVTFNRRGNRIALRLPKSKRNDDHG